VNYFPHLINQGKTLYILESKFSNNGYSTLFKILEVLGQTEYHYYNCNEKNNWEYLLAKTHLEDKILNDIIETICAKNTYIIRFVFSTINHWNYMVKNT
ncbi:unnamed protein product, partial [marine sediment metagenome]